MPISAVLMQQFKKWLLYFKALEEEWAALHHHTPTIVPSIHLKNRAIFQLWWPITVKQMLQMKQTCASKHGQESVYNGAFVYVNVHMCHVVNLCQLCVAVPLTSDHCVGASAGC